MPERVELMFQLVTSRQPTPQEISVLKSALQDHLKFYRSNLFAASKLVSQGESKANYIYDTPELAAYTAVANTILNLDETVYKP